MLLFNYIELQYEKLNTQINNWLSGVYNRSDMTFSPASPHGQIISALKEFFQHNIIYQKNSLSQIDIANSNNEKVIRGIARISGHNATRAISATGVIKFRLKEGLNLIDELGSDSIVIPNNLLLKNQTNGLYYTVVTNSEFSTYNFTNSKEIYLNVIQGKFSTQSFTGNGLDGQSFSINVSNSALVENFEIYIKYNGIQVQIKDSLLDLLPNSYECYTRTGINGGLDVYFGNNSNGFIPANGSKIEVKYLITDGTLGDITNRTLNDFKLIDSVKTSNGDDIAVDNYFDITIEKDISFSSDGETVAYTKSIIPYISRNFVLATPDQFIYHLKRLNMFSKVNAYNLLNDYDAYNKNAIIDGLKNDIMQYITNDVKKVDMMNKVSYLENLNITNDNKIFVYLIPDITKYFSKDVDYFNIPIDAFYLDNDEKQKVYDYLKRMGILIITSDVEIVQPVITRYIMNVYVRRYDDTVESNVRQEIVNVISDYFINNQRFDRVVKSDIISNIKGLSSVDSVDLYFVSQANEAYHADGMLTNNMAPTILDKPTITKNDSVYVVKNYDSTLTIGIDRIMQDIIIESNEMPIIRGGWKDRNGIYYNESPYEQGLGPVNIVFNGVTKRKQ